MLGRRREQILEAAQRVRPYHVAFVGRNRQKRVPVLSRVDIEVVEPEVGHDFLELSFGMDRPVELRLPELPQNEPASVARRRLPLVRGSRFEHRFALRPARLRVFPHQLRRG